MNRKRARELLPIIQAFAEGKEVQWRSLPIYQEWQTTDNPFWCDEDQEPKNTWRIKPEPREFWMSAVKTNYRQVVDCPKTPDPIYNTNWIKVREVLDD